MQEQRHVSNLTVNRGQTVKWRFVLRNGNTPINLTGGEWEVLEPADNTIVMEITDAVNGVSYLEIDKDITAAMRPGRRTIRVRFVDADGDAMAPGAIQYVVR